MKFLIAIWLGATFLSATTASSGPYKPTPISPFDEYGEISWEAEKARLDNFAIQLQQDSDLVGYILVYDALRGCPGEAQARAIRAKSYMVEHRGVLWNRVVWRPEGYQPEIHTVLQPMKRNVILPRPFLGPTFAAIDGPASKECRIKISRIRKSKW
ncbi:MAG: hypothetical protein QOF62_251 [Pyrinomonadaceae bacterium]|jgi:hypothetical protein|nr:hypothetical protein [Pyrinomonadaceae bacterium]